MEKGGGKGKGYWIDNRMRLAAVQPGATWTLMACAARGGLTRVPPHRIMDRFWQPRPKSRMASILETMSMISEFGQQQWLCTNFQCSDRTLRSRDRIFEFSQEIVKICASARNLNTRVNFDRLGRYSTGETPPIKAGRPEPSDHLRSKCLRGNTSTRIWTRALQPDQEEVSSWRFCRAQKFCVPA